MVGTGNRRCQALNRRGEPCGAYATSGSAFCFWHDPASIKHRARASQRGGQARHGRRIVYDDTGEPVTVESVADVVTLMVRAINDALSLENSIQRARTLGYLGGQIIKALELASLEERVTALEEHFDSEPGKTD